MPGDEHERDRRDRDGELEHARKGHEAEASRTVFRLICRELVTRRAYPSALLPSYERVPSASGLPPFG